MFSQVSVILTTEGGCIPGTRSHPGLGMSDPMVLGGGGVCLMPVPGGLGGVAGLGILGPRFLLGGWICLAPGTPLGYAWSQVPSSWGMSDTTFQKVHCSWKVNPLLLTSSGGQGSGRYTSYWNGDLFQQHFRFLKL